MRFTLQKYRDWKRKSTTEWFTHRGRILVDASMPGLINYHLMNSDSLVAFRCFSFCDVLIFSLLSFWWKLLCILWSLFHIQIFAVLFDLFVLDCIITVLFFRDGTKNLVEELSGRTQELVKSLQKVGREKSRLLQENKLLKEDLQKCMESQRRSAHNRS